MSSISRYAQQLMKTTGKNSAELLLGRKLITPFRKLELVMDGAEYVGGNIEKLFDEVREICRVGIRRGRNIIIEKEESG
ncbi:hypothetical protein TNCV_4528301 [Trichonephila clavipes]|nr:hypothetical protein TNCV_4528301 [Trichonephila clavipes]